MSSTKKSFLPDVPVTWARLVGLGDWLHMTKTRMKAKYRKGNTGQEQSRIVFRWSSLPKKDRRHKAGASN